MATILPKYDVKPSDMVIVKRKKMYQSSFLSILTENKNGKQKVVVDVIKHMALERIFGSFSSLLSCSGQS